MRKLDKMITAIHIIKPILERFQDRHYEYVKQRSKFSDAEATSIDTDQLLNDLNSRLN